MKRLLFMLFALTGCASAPPAPPPSAIACTPVEVHTAIRERAAPPAAVVEPFTILLPTVIEPTAPEASSCVTPAGEQTLIDLVDQCITRVEICRAWATE
jgi:hypothetical protein